MSILNLKTMTTSQKFMATEELWEDMSKNVNDESLTPQWHKVVLHEREKQIASGEAVFENFNDAKQDLLKKFS
ncbi:addiction module protein [Sulfurimonas sp. SWIR-19]|uniref:addiction module protein n=1 Tax=Sulfurimonas sp. SWIR-19 TaxID=2878390 RepID=UPI001CF18A59|nr:addiction module protein [Sulfurimonas sp. SWIR-19]UCN01389.1 addiction module protein [Sulfurimonas sp. SWIR-19]